MNSLLSNIYPENMYYYHTINNLKINSFMNSIDKAYENTLNLRDKNIEIVDSELISNIRSICVKYFFLFDSVTQTGDSSIEERKEMLTKKVKPQLQSLLNQQDVRNTDKIIPPLITKLVESNFDRVYKNTEKELILKKLNTIKQNISNDKMKFFTNTYYDAQMKIKEILEIIYLYIIEDKNIDSYQTKYFTSQQQRQVQMNAKKALKSINAGGNYTSQNLNDLMNYLTIKLNSKL